MPEHRNSEQRQIEQFVILKIGKGDGANHLKIDEDDQGLQSVVADRSGFRKVHRFSRVFGSNQVVYAKIGRLLCQRVACSHTGEHSLLFIHGLSNSGRRQLMCDTASSLAADFLSHAPDSVRVQLLLLKGEKVMVDLLKGDQGDVPLTAKVADQLAPAVVRGDEHGTVILTFSVFAADGVVSKLSAVMFEAADRLNQRTHKHPSVIAEMMRIVTDKHATEASLRIASRASKLAQHLHASKPPAFSPGSAIVFITTALTTLNDASEKVLKFTSDLCLAAAGSTLQPVMQSSPLPQPNPSPAPMPQPQPPPSTEPSPDVSIDVTELPYENLTSSHNWPSQSHPHMQAVVSDVGSLETELAGCKALLYESRCQHQHTLALCEDMEHKYTEAKREAAEASLRQIQQGKDLQRLKEGKRRLQLKVTELEEALEQHEAEVKDQRAYVASLQADMSAVVGERDLLSKEAAVLKEALLPNNTTESPCKGSRSANTNEWRVGIKEEVHVLRSSLNDAQENVHQLTQQLAGMLSNNPVLPDLMSTTAKLRINTELEMLYKTKAETYEKRLEAILEGCNESDGGATSERIHWLETTLEKTERLRRKAELELQQHKLDMQSTMVKYENEVKMLTGELAEAKRAVPVMDRVDEERLKALEEQLEALKEDASGSAKLNEKQAEFIQLKDSQIEELQAEVEGLRKSERERHRSVHDYAELTLSTAHLKSEVQMLEAQNRELKEEVEAARRKAAEMGEELGRQQKEKREMLMDAQRVVRQKGSVEDRCLALEKELKEVSEALRQERKAAEMARIERDALHMERSHLLEEKAVAQRDGSRYEVQCEELKVECDRLREGAARVPELERALASVHERLRVAEKSNKALQEGLEQATLLNKQYKAVEQRRYDSDLSAELRGMKDAEQLAEQNLELKTQLQVKTALVHRLEKQLAKAQSTHS